MMSDLSLCVKKLKTIGGLDTIRDASNMMFSQDIGSLLIIDLEELVGIITERDVLRAIGEGCNPDETKVKDYMTSNPVTIKISEDLWKVRDLMIERKFRHMPVVNEGDVVVGIASLRDVLEECARSNDHRH